ncbi:MAG: hypothetical protein U9R72_09330 [Chloroflexota bacterium]|nr:hypothetical protein [Chloroflexota bacterium]
MSILEAMSSDAWLWLAGSLLLAVFWTNLTWLFSPWVEAERSPGEFGSLAERIVVGAATWRFAPTCLQALRLLFYVGLPFAALFWGRDAIVSRFFGLQPLMIPDAGQQGAVIGANWVDWLQDLGWATALGLGAWGLLLVAGWTRRRALPVEERGAGQDQTSSWEAVREAAYHEIHWGFYRNAPIVALGVYRGTWVGLALVALEALANPVWRRGLADPRRAPRQLLRASLAVVSSVLFLQTQNLWLAMTVHWGVSWGLRRMYGVPSDPMLNGMAVEGRPGQ